MKILGFIFILFLWLNGNSQVILDADGPGDTYDLITSVLAPGHNPIEVPDCSHPDFGEHIDEVFDADLNTNVFRFHIHVTPDDDRCINFDRQRNEIKSYDKSPDNLLGVENEIVVYKWKFKLSEGFQSSPNFTHLHQLKSVGGTLASMPMYTLTTRKGSPDRLELRYAETDSQVTLSQTDLAPLIGSWLEVTETIKYGISGTYDLEIKRVCDGEVLFDYSNNDIINWRSGADFVRPKWGIYRSLNNAQDLRDEMVLFANFKIEEIATSSVSIDDPYKESFKVVSNPVNDILYLTNLPSSAKMIEITRIDGKSVLNKPVNSSDELMLDVSSFASGSYIVNVRGGQRIQSKLVVITQR
jgi:hypothetical protein